MEFNHSKFNYSAVSPTGILNAIFRHQARHCQERREWHVHLLEINWCLNKGIKSCLAHLKRRSIQRPRGKSRAAACGCEEIDAKYCCQSQSYSAEAWIDILSRTRVSAALRAFPVAFV